MKILLILHPIDEKRPAGLGRSVYNFAKGIIEERPQDDFVIFTKHPIETLQIFSGCNNIKQVLNNGGKSVWWSRSLRPSKYDLVISFTPIVPLVFFHKNVITFAHDFAYLNFSSRKTKIILWLAHQITFLKSRIIISVSEETKRQVERYFFQLPSTSRHVIYNGFDHFINVPQDDSLANTLPAEYFLSVGVLKERKNTQNTILAFKHFVEKHPNFHLVVIGDSKTSYGMFLKRIVHENHMQHKVIFLDFVNDSMLRVAYAHSSGLIFPSLVEGFGFPILEAMSYGIPVVTSKGGALAEVSGDAAMLINPHSPEEIAEAMITLLDPVQKNSFIEKGRKNLTRFQWKESSQKLSAIINKLFDE